MLISNGKPYESTGVYVYVYVYIEMTFELCGFELWRLASMQIYI